MRTTLMIEDGLLREAKRRAAERHVTVSEVVNEALRESFRETSTSAPPLAWVTYGEPGRPIRHEPTDLAAEIDDEDHRRLA